MTAKEMYMSEEIMRNLKNPLLKQVIISLMERYAKIKCIEKCKEQRDS